MWPSGAGVPGGPGGTTGGQQGWPGRPRRVAVAMAATMLIGAAMGGGIVLTAVGEVVTNNHIIDDATAIEVTDIYSGRTYPASVVGYDAGDDMAVLRLRGAVTSATSIEGVLEGQHPGGKVSIGWTDGVGVSHTTTVVLTSGPPA